MNATNMFGAAEQAAFGKTPDFFEIYVYTVSAGLLTGNQSFNFSATLPAGTFIMGLGANSNGNQQFSTPFTTAGLVSVPDGGMTLMLLGSALVGLATLRRKLS